MDKIFLDIETYQNPNLPKAYLDWKLDELVNKTYTDPKKIAKDKEEKMKKFALDARTGMIIMVGTILYNEAKQTYESNYWYNKSGTEKEEKKILLDSMTFITEAIAGGTRLVTFNGKTFDIPYMVKRAILLKVIPENINILADISRLTRRYYTDIHYDVCEILNGGSANEWGYLLGLVKSPERKGDQIAELYKKKKHNEVVAKNTEDLEILVEIYKRLVLWWK